MRPTVVHSLVFALYVTWAGAACSSTPAGTTPVDAPPATATATAAATNTPPVGESPPGEELSFAVGAPHLKGVVAQSKLPGDVKDAVSRILDGKKVDAQTMARTRAVVPRELGDLLEEVAGGKTVEESMGARGSGVDVVRAVDSDAAERWVDFSRQSEEVEKNLLAFLTAFNARDADALVHTMAFPFYTDAIPRKSPDEVKNVFAHVWKDMGARGEATARGKQCTHMPSEAFAHAVRLGSMTIDDKMRSYVKQVLEGKPGYVSLCEFALLAKDGSVLKDGEAAAFVSRKAAGKHLIVAVHD